MTLPAKEFTKLSELKGVGGHLRWLEKALNEEQTTAISPFSATTVKGLAAWMQKALPQYVSNVTGTAQTESLRNAVFGVQGFGVTDAHVYHGTSYFGATSLCLLVKGSYKVMGAPAGSIAGENIKKKAEI